MPPKRRRIYSKKSKAIFTDLNYECLEHLITFLSGTEQLRLWLVCNWIPIKKLDWGDLIENFSPESVVEILRLIGPCLQNINYIMQDAQKYPIHFEQFNSLVEKFCPNVSLELTVSNLGLTDSDIELIAILSRLKSLNLNRQDRITGQHLNKLRNISYLNLTGCKLFEPKFFIEICRANKFKSLAIQCCCKLDDSAINALIETQTDLKKIEIGCNATANFKIAKSQLKNLKSIKVQNASCLSALTEAPTEQIETLIINTILSNRIPEISAKILNFRNLKRLCLYDDYTIVNNQFLGQIALNCVQLEELIIPGAYRYTFEPILALVRNCENLKFLNLEMWMGFSSILFEVIVGILQRRKSKSLRIHIRWSVLNNFMRSREYKKANLVKLSCDEKDYCKHSTAVRVESGFLPM